MALLLEQADEKCHNDFHVHDQKACCLQHKTILATANKLRGFYPASELYRLIDRRWADNFSAN
jgi:hypothetical protein